MMVNSMEVRERKAAREPSGRIEKRPNGRVRRRRDRQVSVYERGGES
jgi:hypothetical protein